MKVQHAVYSMGSCGVMDKALVFGTKDCRFESCQGHHFCAASRNDVVWTNNATTQSVRGVHTHTVLWAGTSRTAASAVWRDPGSNDVHTHTGPPNPGLLGTCDDEA